MTTCPNCKQTLSEQAGYCPNCGFRMPPLNPRKLITGLPMVDGLLGLLGSIALFVAVCLPFASGDYAALVFIVFSLGAIPAGLCISVILHFAMRYTALAIGVTITWGLMLLGWLGLLTACAIAMVQR